MATLLDIVQKDATSRSITIRIIDSSDGTPELSVVFNTSGIDLWYRREGGLSVDITEADLASPALDDAWADGGFLHINDGEYRLDVPDAAFATGANYVDFGGIVTGMVVIGGRVRLVDYNPEDVVRLGLTALPNAAADAIGGLVISDAGNLDMDAMNDAAVRLTAVRAAVLTDWIDAGRLDLLLDAIPTTAMRGTDSAALASVLGALNDAAAADDPTTGDTLMQYQKQLVNLLAGSTGIGTMPAGANPANGVNLFEMVRAGLGATFDTATDSLEQLQSDILAIDDFLDTEIAAILVDTNSLNDTKIPDTLSLANIKTQVTDAWSVDTHAEIGQTLPPATATFAQMLGLLYKAWRNRSTQTSTDYNLFADNTTTLDQKATVSDDGTTFDKGEVASGP